MYGDAPSKKSGMSECLQSFGLIANFYKILRLGWKHWFCKKGNIKYLVCSKSLSLEGRKHCSGSGLALQSDAACPELLNNFCCCSAAKTCRHAHVLQLPAGQGTAKGGQPCMGRGGALWDSLCPPSLQQQGPGVLVVAWLGLGKEAWGCFPQAEKPGIAAAVGRVSLAGRPRQNRRNFVLSLDLWCLSQVVGGLALQKRKVQCHSHPALASLTLNKGQK